MVFEDDEPSLEGKPLIPNLVKKEGSFFGSVFNLANCILGSGILALPYALRWSGLGVFPLLLFVTAFTARYSCFVLLRLCRYTGQSSYEKLGFEAFGRLGEVVVSACICLQNSGSCISYLIIVGSVVPDVLQSVTGHSAVWTQRETIMILTTALVILPLCLFRRIDMLGYTSSISIAIMIGYTVVCILGKFTFASDPAQAVYWGDTDDGKGSVSTSVDWVVVSDQFVFCLPTMFFSFVCHTSLLPIFNELGNFRRMGRVVNTGISFTWLMYAVASVFAYCTFYHHVDSNVLDNYDSSLLVIRILKIGFAVAVTLTVPVIHFPARKALNNILFRCDSTPLSTHIAETVVVVAGLLGCAIAVPDIMSVFSIIGSSASACIIFILPGLFHLRIHRSEQLLSARNTVPLLLTVGGCVAALFCTTAVLYVDLK